MALFGEYLGDFIAEAPWQKPEADDRGISKENRLIDIDVLDRGCYDKRGTILYNKAYNKEIGNGIQFFNFSSNSIACDSDSQVIKPSGTAQTGSNVYSGYSVYTAGDTTMYWVMKFTRSIGEIDALTAAVNNNYQWQVLSNLGGTTGERIQFNVGYLLSTYGARQYLNTLQLIRFDSSGNDTGGGINVSNAGNWIKKSYADGVVITMTLERSTGRIKFYWNGALQASQFKTGLQTGSWAGNFMFSTQIANTWGIQRYIWYSKVHSDEEVNFNYQILKRRLQGL
jgi:hypothetical protein